MKQDPQVSSRKLKCSDKTGSEMEERVKMICLFVSTSDTLLFCYLLWDENIPRCLCLAVRKMVSKSSTVKLDFRSHVGIKKKIFHIKSLQ